MDFPLLLQPAVKRKQRADDSNESLLIRYRN